MSAERFAQRRRLISSGLDMHRKSHEKTVECPGCDSRLMDKALSANKRVCPRCGRHFSFDATSRLRSVFDDDSYEIIGGRHVTDPNPIDFPGYEEKIGEARRKTGLAEACLSAVGAIGGVESVVTALDNRFLMGSMGSCVGETITQSIETAMNRSLPLIIFSSSGGARMQEGLVSLMQMAKTSAAIKAFSDSGGFYVSCLTDPTMGGVSASFAFLGDITLAEPGALIGFAGPRVIEQTIGEKLPEGFQRAEFLLEHGFIDAVVPRAEMRDVLVRLLRLHRRDQWTS